MQAQQGTKMKKWILVAGARPNFMKIAPLMKEIATNKEIDPILVHTGQHYTPGMSKVFFDELDIPEPQINLEVGSGTHAQQTAEIMKRFEPVLEKEKPVLVIVVGDVNSTIACALTAAKLNIKVAHVEAGLRSFDRTMPEELNRILTDALADYLFITEPAALDNLLREGIPRQKIFFVGNTMIDTLKANLEKIEQSPILHQLKLEKQAFVLLTLHRPANVDRKEEIVNIRRALEKIAKTYPVVFPAHPRTVERMKEFHVDFDFLTVVPPLGYIDFMNLVLHSYCVLTDSGGIQEETTALGKPCITLRENTERPVTIQQGTNRLTGTNPKKIIKAISSISQNPRIRKPRIKYWDGKAAQRIVKILLEKIK